MTAAAALAGSLSLSVSALLHCHSLAVCELVSLPHLWLKDSADSDSDSNSRCAC